MSQRGISTIQIVMMAGVGSAVALAIMTMVFQQVREVNAIAARVGFRDLRHDVETALSNVPNCLATLQGVTIDDSRAGDPLYSIPVASIRQLNPNPRILAQAGNSPHGMISRAIVSNISLGEITRLAANSYEADVLVTYLVSQKSLRSSVGRIRIATDSASVPTAKLPTSCSTKGNGGGPDLNNCVIATASATTSGEYQPTCNAGQTLVNSGIFCLSPDGTRWDYATPHNLKGYVFRNHPQIVAGNLQWISDCYNHVGVDGTRVQSFGVCCP